MAIGWATPYYRRKLMDAASNVAAYTTPTTGYLGITTAVLSESASVLPSPSPEATGNGYVRASFPWDSSFWTAADASGTTTNLLAVVCFTASATWSTAGVGFFLADAASAGNLLVAGAIDIDKLVLPLSGEQVVFPPGSITRTFAAP